MSDVTQLLRAIGGGNPHATAELLPHVYDELRRLARSKMAQERADHTLQATALVHEAFVRLVNDEDPSWDGRGHFFAAAAEAMRRILVEHARRKHAIKHGGGLNRVAFDDAEIEIRSPCDDLVDLLSLDGALDSFSKDHGEAADLVKLLYFAGLNLEEAASAQGISRTTAYRRWLFARAWLREALAEASDFSQMEQDDGTRGMRISHKS